MALKTLITLAAVAGLVTMMVNRRPGRAAGPHRAREGADRTGLATVYDTARHRPANTFSPAMDATDGLARGRSADPWSRSAS